MRRSACWLALCLLSSASLLAESPVRLPALSKPSADVTLNFTKPGRVAELKVKEGDAVAANQLLVKLDDREEQAALAQDRARAEDITKVKAQEAVTQLKEFQASKMEDMAKKGAVSPWERDEARLNAVVERARLKLTNFEHEMDQLKFEQSSIAVAKMQLKTPIAGVVETTQVKVGESVEPQTKVIRIVCINPLWVEVPVPLAQALQLKKGQSGTVTFSDKATAEGKIIHVASLADAGSGTLLVRLEVPNAAQRPAGERVGVEFPAAKVTQR